MSLLVDCLTYTWIYRAMKQWWLLYIREYEILGVVSKNNNISFESSGARRYCEVYSSSFRRAFVSRNGLKISSPRTLQNGRYANSESAKWKKEERKWETIIITTWISIKGSRKMMIADCRGMNGTENRKTLFVGFMVVQHYPLLTIVLFVARPR